MSANSLRPKTVNSRIGSHPQGARDQQAAKKENNMKKPKAKKKTMLAEYDFSSGTKGKYAKLYNQGTNLILLEPDVAEAFPDSKSVNDSLRALASIIQVRSTLDSRLHIFRQPSSLDFPYRSYAFPNTLDARLWTLDSAF
jgi:hypothetical protein